MVLNKYVPISCEEFERLHDEVWGTKSNFVANKAIILKEGDELKLNTLLEDLGNRKIPDLKRIAFENISDDQTINEVIKNIIQTPCINNIEYFAF